MAVAAKAYVVQGTPALAPDHRVPAACAYGSLPRSTRVRDNVGLPSDCCL